ncbi:MAG: hypothetical protein WD052_09005 [Bacteroidales bacterium]
MIRTVTISIILLFLSGNTIGQLKTYIVPGTGTAWDINRVQDQGKMFSQANTFGMVSGVAIWQDITPNFSLGSGVWIHQYTGGINVKDSRPHQAGFNSYQAILIPALISYRIQIPDLLLSLTPRLGYQYGMVRGGGNLQNASSLVSGETGETITYELQDSPPDQDNLHLIEAGISLDYRFPNNWQFSLGFSHFSGLSEVKYSTIDYQSTDGNNYQAVYTSDGSRIQSTLHLHIPVSNLWENLDVRIRRRVENSVGTNASARSQRYIYFGGDLGAHWRSFSTSNPAVGPFPISGKGIFKYSNLFAGGYLGFMFNSQTGLDIGAYYQRSGSYLSIMYDHESDFDLKQSAPMFLNFPLMFRYYYDLYDKKLFLVPAIGASVMTHFTAPLYDDGNGTFEYSTLTGTGTATFDYQMSRPARIGYTARAGIGLEYDIPTPFPLLVTFNVIYSHGLTVIDQMNVSTSIPESPAESTISYNGTGWNTTFGVRIPIVLGAENRKCGAMPMRR